MTLLNILQVDVVNSRIETQFELKLSWFDSWLSFQGLKEQEYQNWVTRDQDIWKPRLRLGLTNFQIQVKHLVADSTTQKTKLQRWMTQSRGPQSRS